MASRTDWLDAGLEILASHGARGLTIERLMERMQLTKGSFYHHFRGMPGFKTALLEHYENELTTRYISEAEQTGATADEKLSRLLDLTVDDDRAGPEVALRAWAMQDADVAEMLRKVDRTRIDYLRDVWLQQSGDKAEAETMGRLLYLILVGANHVLPPVAGDDLRAVYAVVLGESAKRTPPRRRSPARPSRR